MAADPLQVIIFRHEDDTDLADYEDAAVRVFKGGQDRGDYSASGDDLGIQLEVFSATRPPKNTAETLDSFSHTLVIVFVDYGLLVRGTDELWNWLHECWVHVNRSDGRHGMLVVPIDERTGSQFSRKRDSFEKLQFWPAHQFGERAIRPARVALLILHECRKLLAKELPPENGNPPGFLRLFISHAKLDGIPLAHALKHQIDEIPWLSRFYDVDDIPPGSNWQRELERGVGSSVIIMLRTEEYDDRHWCQKEVFWSDEYATPAVLVDARVGLAHRAAILPFDRVPTVRIPDGNLMRILFLALREGLRFLYFMRLIEEMKRTGEVPGVELRVFCLAPSMAALLRACRSISLTRRARGALIIYPDPPLRTGLYEAAQALVMRYSRGTRLVTPDTLSTTR